MSQSQRQRSLKNFEHGRADTLVATDVAARGLDVDAITHVINFDPPADAVAYTHRVGRTGRAGRSGTGITFVLPDERDAVATIARAKDLHAAAEAAGLPGPEGVQQRKGGKRGGQHEPRPVQPTGAAARRRCTFQPDTLTTGGRPSGRRAR